MSISPERVRVTDAAHQMPIASMDVQLSPETRTVDAGTLIGVGDAVISAAQGQLPVSDSEIVLSDGRTWGEYSRWPAYVRGGSASLSLCADERERTTTDGRKWYGQDGYSTWNPRRGL